MKKIAHRGLPSDHVKENTLAAFQNAIKSRDYDGFECDIRTTKDHVFIIYHNLFLGSEYIGNLKWEDIKDKQIPTLEEVLKLKTEKIMLLEIKEPNLDVKKLKKLLEKYPNKNVYIDSFDKKIIKKLKKENPPCKLGVLNYVLNSEATYEDYDFIGLLSPVTSENLIAYFQNKNIAVFLYGNNKKIEKPIEDVYYII